MSKRQHVVRKRYIRYVIEHAYKQRQTYIREMYSELRSFCNKYVDYVAKKLVELGAGECEYVLQTLYGGDAFHIQSGASVVDKVLYRYDNKELISSSQPNRPFSDKKDIRFFLIVNIYK